MGEPLAYALEIAPRDVSHAIESLVDAGFAVDVEIGGRGESFGNVHLQLTRGATHVVVTRDRSQWYADVQPAWAPNPIPMHVLVSARDGTPPADSEAFLPTQLPEGARP